MNAPYGYFPETRQSCCGNLHYQRNGACGARGGPHAAGSGAAAGNSECASTGMQPKKHTSPPVTFSLSKYISFAGKLHVLLNLPTL